MRVKLCVDTAEFIADGVTQLRLFLALTDKLGVVQDDSQWYNWEDPTFLEWGLYAGMTDPCVVMVAADDDQIIVNGFALHHGVWRHMVENDMTLVGDMYVTGGSQSFKVRPWAYANGTDYDALNVAYVGATY